MSLVQIKAVVEDFISDTRNGLLVIKGKWGAGKTFFWQKLIDECQTRKCVGRDYYAYVSLFGVNSLEELNNSILASRVDSNPNKIQKTFDNLTANLKNLGRRLEKVPAIREYTGGMISAFLHLLLDNTLVCFDDMERRGDDLAIKDIFGLASVLREQRGCKVVLIMNEEGLDEEGRKQFKLHGEKIIDREILFSITAEEAFSYIFPKSFKRHGLIKECCLLLDVKNIRTLQRIRRFIEDITPRLKGMDETVAESAVRSIILFVWSYYEQESGAPPLEFVLKYSTINSYIAKKNKQDLRPEEKEWDEILRSYSYYRTDGVDKCLAEFVETGYVDKPRLERELGKENEQARLQQGQNSLRQAWEMYRSSFDDNEQEFVENLVGSFRSNIKIMSLSNLDGVATTVREFGQDERAKSLVDEYFNEHNSEEDMTAFRLSKGTIFVSDIRDGYLLGRLNHIWTSDEYDKRSLADMVKTLTSQSGWNEEDIRRLDSFGADDYYKFFKTEKSPDLYHYVRKCLDFGKIQGAGEMYKSISEKAKEALLKIGAESRINRMRVSTLYNIEVE